MAVESSITSTEFDIPETVWVASRGISNQRFHMLPEAKNAFTGIAYGWHNNLLGDIQVMNCKN